MSFIYSPNSGGVTTGTYAARPAANSVSAGTMYMVTGDSSNARNGVVYVSDGAVWRPFSYNKRYPTLTANLHWKFDEASGATTLVNSGSLGASGNLTLAVGPSFGIPGIFGDGAAYFPGSTGKFSGGGTCQPGTTAFTIISWFTVRRVDASLYRTIYGKAYRNDGTWTTPWVSIHHLIENSNDGKVSWRIAYGSGTTVQIVSPSSISCVRPNIPTMTALTWDGNNLTGYLNGIVVSTTNIVGGPHSIDYNGSANGAWTIGAQPSSNITDLFEGQIHDIRSDNTTWTQAAIGDAYDRGLYQWVG